MMNDESGGPCGAGGAGLLVIMMNGGGMNDGSYE